MAEELLHKPSALPANQALVRQASLDGAQMLAIAQLRSTEFCAVTAKMPGVVSAAEAFVRAVTVARPTVMPAAMRLSFALAHRRCVCQSESRRNCNNSADYLSILLIRQAKVEFPRQRLSVLFGLNDGRNRIVPIWYGKSNFAGINGCL